jgi:hypothetical protein
LLNWEPRKPVGRPDRPVSPTRIHQFAFTEPAGRHENIDAEHLMVMFAVPAEDQTDQRVTDVDGRIFPVKCAKWRVHIEANIGIGNGRPSEPQFKVGPENLDPRQDIAKPQCLGKDEQIKVRNAGPLIARTVQKFSSSIESEKVFDL